MKFKRYLNEGIGRLGLHLMKNPAGTYSFVGSVPVELGYLTKSGKELTPDEAKEVARANMPAMLTKTRVFKTPQEAFKVAKKYGYKEKDISFNEGKIFEQASKYKKEFIKYAYEIIDNILKHYNRSETTSVEFFKEQVKQIQSSVVRIMGTMALPTGNPNYANMKKFMPKKFNKQLFDNGDENTYDSEWMSMTDSKQFTIAREAVLKMADKLGASIKRSDLIK